MIRALALTAMLAGCAAIDHGSAPADWPQLKVIVLRTDQAGIDAFCPGGFMYFPIACMRPDFDRRECYVWLHHEASKFVEDHELDHCNGKDHALDSTLSDYFAAWKAKRVQAATGGSRP